VNAPRTPPVPTAKRWRDAVVVALASLAILAGGLLLFGRRREPPARPDPGATLLSEEIRLTNGAASSRFRLRSPSDVGVTIEGPAGAEVAFALGAPQPPKPGEPDLPGPGPTWTARAGDAPKRLPLFMAGQYVLRVEARSAPPPPTVRVSVRAIEREE
jgi:hypothetical protein